MKRKWRSASHGWNPRHQVLHKYRKLAIGRNFCHVNVPVSDLPRAVEDPQLAQNAKAQPCLRAQKAFAQKLGSGPTVAGWTLPLGSSHGGSVGWRTLATLAAVSGCSCEPARAARERSGAVLTRAGRTCQCLIVVGLGRMLFHSPVLG